jgi:site-specific DNA-methyltransferase (cytosine-N4-specific)
VSNHGGTNSSKKKISGRKRVIPSYKTRLGSCFNESIEDFLTSEDAKRLQGKINLVFTSPPFPLASPKAYGNLAGQEYLDWIIAIVEGLIPLLSDDGSIVMEIGNVWDKGSPTMSTLPLRTLLAIEEQTELHLCQQFIWENSAKLPGPATWVNTKRIRLKDSHTQVWWFGKTKYPKADNRQVLADYSPAMKKLIRTGKYNAGERPSEHVISDKHFAKNNKGAIHGSTIAMGNTAVDPNYSAWCKSRGLKMHPARMPIQLAEFFIHFLTDEGDRVLDPFGGSNTTGRACEDLNRKWTVVERDSDYVEGSRGRFEKP